MKGTPGGCRNAQTVFPQYSGYQVLASSGVAQIIGQDAGVVTSRDELPKKSRSMNDNVEEMEDVPLSVQVLTTL